MKKTLKSIYDVIPLKKNVFSFAKNFVSPSERIHKHLHFKGNIRIPIDREYSFKVRHHGYEVENSLFWAGIGRGWEKVSLSLWVKLVRDANVIFDIGANTGVYSLIAKSLNPNAQVYAFEPVARVFEKLEYNIKLNDFDVVCLDSAASNTDGTATIYDTSEEHTYSVTVNENLNANNIAVVPTTIKTVRLDTIIKSNQIEKVDLIKIDVETHEAEVIEGLGEYLEKFKPTMLVEILNDEVGRKVQALVDNKGYAYFNLDEETGSIRRVDEIIKSDYFNYLFCSEEMAEKILEK
ncbi:MAG: FkbM family methyltransferase [Pyrinomonadaceae bacterium]|nr:FkbM family methyltransferase [Pyrinomonadaceae bacterium]